jgi:4a-hydroxytetrahydrobiopterin dehydratase
LLDLTDKKCEACTIDAPLVNSVDYPELLKELEDWSIEEESINKLVKTYNFTNYADSVSFTNKIADLAKAEDHHPKIVLQWGSVKLEWWSHKIKGLHLNDFICAAKSDKIFNSL